MSDPRKFKNDIVVEGDIVLPAETAERVLVIDAANEVASSTVTIDELELLSGATEDLSVTQAKVDDLVTLSGVAANSTDLGTFTGDIIPDGSDVKEAFQSLETAIESLPDPMEYKGVWDASTNTPTLTDGTGNNGDVWYVSVAGTQFTPPIAFAVGDKAVYNGASGKYEKWDTTESVTSVNGQTGIVVLDTDDIAEGGTNLYFEDERAQDAVGSILLDSDSIDLTYDDVGPSISADVITQNSITVAPGGIQLVNDDATPGNTYYYGTDGTGVKGFFAIPAAGSTNDIEETDFNIANNQASPANVTGFLFGPTAVRSFSALVSVEIFGTADLYEQFTLQGINKGSTFNMSVDSVGDNSGITFSITSAGQVQYTSGNVPGFTLGTVKFRAITTTF